MKVSIVAILLSVMVPFWGDDGSGSAISSSMAFAPPRYVINPNHYHSLSSGFPQQQQQQRHVCSSMNTSMLLFSAISPDHSTESQSQSLIPENGHHSIEETFSQVVSDNRMVPPMSFDNHHHWNNDVQHCLELLERRLQMGPGSIHGQDLSDFEAAMARIFSDIEMKYLQSEQQPQNQSQSKSQPQSMEHEMNTTGTVVSGTVTMMQDSTPDVSVENDDSTPYSPLAATTATASTSVSPFQETPVDGDWKLKIAASNMDPTTVSKLLQTGFKMDEETTDAAFKAVIDAVNRAEEQNVPLSADIPRMLHHIFDADLDHLLSHREQQRTNVTCMQPDESDGVGGSARRMNYIFDDAAHKDLPLTEGRRCEDGHCCDACSRNIFPTFAQEHEVNFQIFPELASITLNELQHVAAGTILQFVRLVERVRRTISYEYGVPLSTILPLQAYSRKYVAGTTQQGGGGGEGDYVTLHTDEATHSGYHYSCVLYLSTQGEDFEGGDFVFNDPVGEGEEDSQSAKKIEDIPPMSLAEEIRRAGRKLTPFHPTRGSAVIFSSGWENMHEVETVTSGTRYTVPCFFTTCPVPEVAYDQMVAGKPKDDDDIADDWLHLLLAHRKETPVESVGRVKELLMKWHCMCTPLDQH